MKDLYPGAMPFSRQRGRPFGFRFNPGKTPTGCFPDLLPVPAGFLPPFPCPLVFWPLSPRPFFLDRSGRAELTNRGFFAGVIHIEHPTRGLSADTEFGFASR